MKTRKFRTIQNDELRDLSGSLSYY